MNSGLEFHDSRVSSVQSANDVVIVIFESAYLHRSEGVPGGDKGTGWTQAGSLEFASAFLTSTGDIGEGWIVEGCVSVDGADEVRLIPVPFNVAGKVTASFTFNNGCVLQVRSESARLTLTGEARFVEDFPG